MDMKLKEVKTSIEKRIAGLEENLQRLKKDSREDEAVLCKVRINICDIYNTMLYATRKKVDAMGQLQAEEQEQRFCQEYMNLMNKITSTWVEGLQAAKKADDYRAVLVEEIKLETAKLLEEEFQKVFGETYDRK